MTQSKHFFENDRIKSSRRYNEEEADFDDINALSNRDGESNEVDHVAEIEHDRIQAVKHSQSRV